MLMVFKAGIAYQAVSGFKDSEGMKTVFIQAGSLTGYCRTACYFREETQPYFPEIVAILNCRLCFFSL